MACDVGPASTTRCSNQPPHEVTPASSQTPLLSLYSLSSTVLVLEALSTFAFKDNRHSLRKHCVSNLVVYCS